MAILDFGLARSLSRDADLGVGIGLAEPERPGGFGVADRRLSNNLLDRSDCIGDAILR